MHLPASCQPQPSGSRAANLATRQRRPSPPMPSICRPLHASLPPRRRSYELHHGVKISDSALVEAAVLSDRYIADRFLPGG